MAAAQSEDTVAERSASYPCVIHPIGVPSPANSGRFLSLRAARNEAQVRKGSAGRATGSCEDEDLSKKPMVSTEEWHGDEPPRDVGVRAVQLSAQPLGRSPGPRSGRARA
jgi:hypothetical protein